MDSLIRRASEMHSASGVARKLMTLMQNANFSTSEVGQCIERDPAISARILATVNSVSYGAVRRVSSIKQAIAMLGHRKLRRIVLAFSVIEKLTRGIDADVYTEYWKRSITTSLVSQILADDKQVDPNDAYTAGLLADIGVLVLAQFESERYFPIVENHSHGPALTKAEREAFGFDHTDLGAALLKIWHFPDSLVNAVATHHEGEPSEPLACVVRAGSLMPRAIWGADSQAFHAAYAYFQSQYKCNIESFVDIASEVNEQVEDEARIYGVEGIEAVDCESLRLEAKRLREQTSESSVRELVG